MYVSRETPQQTTLRLRRVIAAAQLFWHQDSYAFEEYPLTSFPKERIGNALAFVRDFEVWSVLVPARSNVREIFAVFSFHFADSLDNSGFVGWLASELKSRLGTGVFVICGQNARRGGVFDYWGVPEVLREEVSSIISHLQSDRDVL